MRIGVLTQWYPPEPGPAALPGALAQELASRGHDVQVVTGFPNYPTGLIAPGFKIRRRVDHEDGGVHVRRVALYPSHSASTSKRLLTYGSFGASALVNGLSALRGVDALWVNYSPITVAWAMWAARAAYRVPVLTHVLDLWPDTLHASGFAPGGPAGRLASSTLEAWCRGMYRSSAAVAYISPGVGEVLARRGVPQSRLHYAPMWADETIFRPSDDDLRSRLGLPDDAVVLLYAGTLGAAQGLESLVDACSRVRDPRFVCLIAGSGIAEDSLRQRAERAGATNLRFLGRVPPEDMTRLTATADLSYVGLRPHALSRITMPSKTQASLAAGRALLVAAEGDVASVTEEGGVGLVVPPGDPSAITAAIEHACELGRPALRAMGEAARVYYQAEFSLRSGVDRIEPILERIARDAAR